MLDRLIGRSLERLTPQVRRNVDERHVQPGSVDARHHAHHLEGVVQEPHALPRSPLGDQALFSFLLAGDRGSTATATNGVGISIDIGIGIGIGIGIKRCRYVEISVTASCIGIGVGICIGMNSLKKKIQPEPAFPFLTHVIPGIVVCYIRYVVLYC